jgi:hypothetical protein
MLRTPLLLFAALLVQAIMGASPLIRRLAEALANGDLAPYQAEHKRILRRPTFLARAMLLMENRARRCRALRALSSSLRIFARTLAVHVSAAPPFKRAANRIEPGWRMLAG